MRNYAHFFITWDMRNIIKAERLVRVCCLQRRIRTKRLCCIFRIIRLI